MRGLESNVASLQQQTARQIKALTAVNQTLEDVGTEVEEMQETMHQNGVDISNLEATKDELQTKVKLHCTVLKQKC